MGDIATVKITKEEYKDLLEAKFFLQHAERVIERKIADRGGDTLFYAREVAELLGIELHEQPAQEEKEA